MQWYVHCRFPFQLFCFVVYSSVSLINKKPYTNRDDDDDTTPAGRPIDKLHIQPTVNEVNFITRFMCN